MVPSTNEGEAGTGREGRENRPIEARGLTDGIGRRGAMTTLAGGGLLAGAGLLGGIGEQLWGPIGEREGGSDRPNLVFVISDDHRYDFLSFLDEPGTPEFLETPHLSRMAREGTHLENAFVTTSLCAPSRASILTGQYAHQHGVTGNKRRFGGDVAFFPKLLQEAGYETALIGKWHIGHGDADPRPGFDRWVSFPGQGRYVDPVFNVDGERVPRKGYITDLLTEYATDWLRERGGEPFCLYLSHKSVHRPFRPAKRHRGRYDDTPVPRPWAEGTEKPTRKDSRNDRDGKTAGRGGEGSEPESENERDGPGADKPQWVYDQRDSVHGIGNVYRGQMSFEELYRRYCETLLSLDESVGSILETLRQRGIDADTLTLYMGDNGFLMGEHGLIDKRAAYEESIRVPMLAHAPGLIEPGTAIEELVTNVDIAPTLLDAAGTPTPEGTSGRSFLPLLDGEEVSWRDGVLYEYFHEEQFPQQPTMLAFRTHKYKLVRYRWPWVRDEFYDLRTDPGERVNRIGSPGLRPQIRGMNGRLFDRLRAVDGMDLAPWQPPERWEPGRNENADTQEPDSDRN